MRKRSWRHIPSIVGIQRRVMHTANNYYIRGNVTEGVISTQGINFRKRVEVARLQRTHSKHRRAMERLEQSLVSLT